jgi:hypothetical protein
MDHQWSQDTGPETHTHAYSEISLSVPTKPNRQVLVSRGIIVGSDGSPRRTIRMATDAGGGPQGDGSAIGAGGLSEAIDMVAAVIAFNNLTLEEAYSAFDQDGDGVLSVGDFRKSCMTLQLEVTQVRNLP